MDDAANAMQDSVDTADRNTKTTIRNAKESFMAEQRAWVGLGQYRIDNFNDKDPFKMSLPWVNSGKTPAVMTETGVAYSISPSRLTGPPAGHKYMFEKASAIAPAGIYVTNIANAAIPPKFAAINDGTLWLYFFGLFRYRDVHIQIVHSTTFCLYYSTMTKTMAFCDNGNDMD